MATSSDKVCGHVTVELLCRLGDSEPQSLGFIQLPLTIRAAGVKTIEGNLEDAVSVTKLTLERIFKDGPDEPGATS